MLGNLADTDVGEPGVPGPTQAGFAGLTSRRLATLAVGGSGHGIWGQDQRAAAMYSRSVLASWTVSAMRVLTTSPIDTMPTRRFSSTTGRCRKRPSVMVSIRLST